MWADGQTYDSRFRNFANARAPARNPTPDGPARRLITIPTELPRLLE